MTTSFNVIELKVLKWSASPVIIIVPIALGVSINPRYSENCLKKHWTCVPFRNVAILGIMRCETLRRKQVGSPTSLPYSFPFILQDGRREEFVRHGTYTSSCSRTVIFTGCSMKLIFVWAIVNWMKVDSSSHTAYKESETCFSNDKHTNQNYMYIFV